MKVLIFSRYENKGASSRLRLFQYISFLEENGIVVSVSPLLDNEYVDSIYYGSGYSKLKILKSYFNRFLKILSCNKFDLLLIEKELFPLLPAWTEYLLHLIKKPYVVDIDDATFHGYDKNPKRIVRCLLKNKMATVLRFSSLVIAGNSYLAQYARKAGARSISILPTVVNLERYPVKKQAENSLFTIGWIGSPSTLKYIKLIEPALKELSKKINFRLVIVGAQYKPVDNITAVSKEWSENTEIADILAFSVGIMPLADDDWERGKCGYKIIQYMACGIPVIASPVGINEEIISHGSDGYLAYTTAEWIKYFEILANDPELCIKMGKMGRVKVENQYCTHITSPKFMGYLLAACPS